MFKIQHSKKNYHQCFLKCAHVHGSVHRKYFTVHKNIDRYNKKKFVFYFNLLLKALFLVFLNKFYYIVYRVATL